MNLRPFNDRLVIEPLEQDEQLPSGIFLPESAKEKPQQGRVLAVGLGLRDETGKRISPEAQVGDIVLFGKYAGLEVKLDGKKYVIMKESDVLGVLENVREFS